MSRGGRYRVMTEVEWRALGGGEVTISVYRRSRRRQEGDGQSLIVVAAESLVLSNKVKRIEECLEWMLKKRMQGIREGTMSFTPSRRLPLGIMGSTAKTLPPDLTSPY